MAIVTLQEIKDYVGETTGDFDAFLQDQIDLIQQAMEHYCGRRFDELNYTQTFYRDFIEQETVPKIFTYHYPVNSITSITEGELVPSDEFLLKPNEGQIRRMCDDRAYTWFRCDSKITVVYNAGYTDANAPRDLKQVIFAIASENYNKQKAGVNINFGNNVQRISIAGVMSIDFDYTLNSNERSSRFGMILGDWANVLDYYRSERSITGEIWENYVV